MRTRLLALVATLALAAGASACQKPSVQECDKACRNANRLLYWDEVEKEAATLPEAERAAFRASKESEFHETLQKGIDHCIAQCRSADNDAQVKCFQDAKTADEIRKCKDVD
jgi:hypothetical protein